MKNKFFVTVSKTVKITYTKDNKLMGDRFLIKAEFITDSLNKDGFVVDFSKTNTILDYVKENLENRPLNDILKGDFSFEKLLIKIVELINKKTTFTNAKLSKLILEGDNEGYKVELL